MPVPDYQTLMLPVLRRLGASTQPVAVREFRDSIAQEFALTEADLEERLPSGQDNVLTNRIAWARTYLGKAGLLSSSKRPLIEITDQGRALLAERPPRIDLTVLHRYPEFQAWIARSQAPRSSLVQPDEGTFSASIVVESKQVETTDSGTPRERLDRAQREIEVALRAEVLDRVRELSPSDFEGLIVQLLLAMGYGEGLEDMARALGGSGDGGVDGVVPQDPLGLDRVYIQAKRWKDGNGVSSPDIRNFVGALNIHRASKGVFVTASHFTHEAKQAARNSTLQVVLIDGEALAELMVRYKVGVIVRGTIDLMDIDEGFFER